MNTPPGLEETELAEDIDTALLCLTADYSLLLSQKQRIEQGETLSQDAMQNIRVLTARYTQLLQPLSTPIDNNDVRALIPVVGRVGARFLQNLSGWLRTRDGTTANTVMKIAKASGIKFEE